MNYEMGFERQIKVSSSTAHPQCGSITNFVTGIRAQKTRNFNNMLKKNRKLNQMCPNCGQSWNFEHRKVCLAQEKNCLKCGLQKYFLQKCVDGLKKSKFQFQQRTKNKRNNNVETEETTTLEDNNFIELQDIYNPDFDSNYSFSHDKCVATICSESKLNEPIDQNPRIGAIETMIIVDSGSVKL